MESSSITYGIYKLITRIGSGSFGDVWNASPNINDSTIPKTVALKLEHGKNSLLQNEYRIMERIYNYSKENFKRVYSPQVYTFGTDKESNYLAMQLMGDSLYKLKPNEFNQEFIVLIARMTLEAITSIHKSGFIHRDIKPENIVIGGKGYEQNMYFIDFGLSKNIAELKEENKYNGLIGTARYASINSHMGKEQSYRDDLESLLYVWLFLMVDKLPWQGFRGIQKNCFPKILKLKKDLKIEEFIKSKYIKMTIEFKNFLIQYHATIKKMEFNELIDDAAQLKMLDEIISKNGFSINHLPWCYQLYNVQQPRTGQLLIKPRKHFTNFLRAKKDTEKLSEKIDGASFSITEKTILASAISPSQNESLLSNSTNKSSNTSLSNSFLSSNMLLTYHPVFQSSDFQQYYTLGDKIWSFDYKFSTNIFPDSDINIPFLPPSLIEEVAKEWDENDH